ncbi:MAG TPA: hypothetical protein VE999_17040 [Gemmataceae bacterium]|nr:hypothetical protein [Gemmataceae bacterium]
MARLQKFIERGAFGEGPLRTAYTLGAEKLPEPTEGARWCPVSTFSAADELLENSALKEVIKNAIDSGCAVISPKKP